MEGTHTNDIITVTRLSYIHWDDDCIYRHNVMGCIHHNK